MRCYDLSSEKAAFFVLGANTGVGKTVISAGLCATLRRRGTAVHYIKPWQTGYPEDCDARTVASVAPGVVVSTLDPYPEAVSPHRAHRNGERCPDQTVLHQLVQLVRAAPGVVLVEGAGGVASPTPAGQLQCDAFRAVLMPVLVVADPRLGGISATITAVEQLEGRGFEVLAVLCMHGEHQNGAFLTEYFRTRRAGGAGRPEVLQLSAIAPDEDLAAWIDHNAVPFTTLATRLDTAWQETTAAHTAHLRSAADTLWWPFTQHTLVPSPTVIESAYGDDLAVTGAGPLFDACASWWTQCLGHAHPGLVRTAAHSAARFGHVIFPENIHAPAAELSARLLAGVGRDWAARVFLSDNGSTSVEVGLKMAFRLRLTRLAHPPGGTTPLTVVGLTGSYHGDTLGAMEAASPSAFNAREPWYSGHHDGSRGDWFPAPIAYFNGSAWCIEEPEAFQAWSTQLCGAHLEDFQHERCGDSAAALFTPARGSTARAARYRKLIHTALETIEARGRIIGALLLEPLVHGSSGMVLIDPLFQRVLAQSAQARGIPIVYDEVFTGLWRVGFERAADALDVRPDIACYSKSLTGGLVPLGATLASAEVFEAFRGSRKLDALLHGHSYTAYPLGCAVAAEALALLTETAARDGRGGTSTTGPGRSLFSAPTITALAEHPQVERTWSLGSVFACSLRAGREEGYGSLAAQRVVGALRQDFGIYSRPLGNVLYGVVSLTTPPERADSVVSAYLAAIERAYPAASSNR
jgi:dethiobiotin synthetase/adenosylmethionine--8-amino-7-oxononanoate aminotransferase